MVKIKVIATVLGLIAIPLAAAPPATAAYDRAASNANTLRLFEADSIEVKKYYSWGRRDFQFAQRFHDAGNLEDAVENYSSANHYFEKALGIDSEHAESLYWSGRAFVALSLLNDEEQDFHSRGIEQIIKAINLDPEYRGPQEFLGHVLADRARESPEDQWNVIESYADSIKNNSARFNIMRAAGNKLYEGIVASPGDAKTALFFYTAASKIKPNPELDSPIAYLRGITGGVDERIAYLKDNANKNPSVENYFMLGDKLEKTDPEGAVTAYDNAIRIGSGKSRSGEEEQFYRKSLSARANISRKADDMSGAISLLEKLYALDSQWRDKFGSAGLRLANAYFSSNMHGPAIKYFTKHLPDDSKDVENVRRLALSYKEAENFGKAAETFEKIKGHLEPADFLFWADCYGSNSPEEIRILERSIEILGNNGDTGHIYHRLGGIFLDMGKYYEEQKDPRNAVSAYEKAKEYYRLSMIQSESVQDVISGLEGSVQRLRFFKERVSQDTIKVEGKK